MSLKNIFTQFNIPEEELSELLELFESNGDQIGAFDQTKMLSSYLNGYESSDNIGSIVVFNREFWKTLNHVVDVQDKFDPNINLFRVIHAKEVKDIHLDGGEHWTVDPDNPKDREFLRSVDLLFEDPPQNLWVLFGRAPKSSCFFPFYSNWAFPIEKELNPELPLKDTFDELFVCKWVDYNSRDPHNSPNLRRLL